MKKIGFSLLIFLWTVDLFSQVGVVMNNDAYIVISNNAYLVIGNSGSNGIVQAGTGGRIISEAEGNKVRWMVSNATGTYTVPFYESGEGVEIPVTAVITAAGTAGATNRIDFSTYDGASSDNATYMPSGVTNMGNVTIPAANNSVQVTDRFWILDANHATKPAATLSFTYVDAENAAPNTLAEANLKAQRWNATTADWDGFLFPPVGTANTATNVVSAVIVPAADFFAPWTLVDFTTPLPIELISNSVSCESNTVVMNWSTASESNNSFFTIERSTDGINFVSIGTVLGANNSSSILNYSFADNHPHAGTSYYRLKQTDFDGNTVTFDILTSEDCSSNSATVTLNAFNDQNGNISIVIDDASDNAYTAILYDAVGKRISSTLIRTVKGSNQFNIDISSINAGIYFISVENEKQKISKKIFIF